MCGAGVFLALALFAVPASAWELSKSSNGVVVNRQSTDSSQGVNVYVYYDYKGGSYWSSGQSPSVTSSYNANDFVGLVFSTGDTGQSIEIALKPNYRCQLVVLSQSGVGQKTFAVLNEIHQVSVIGTPTVAVSNQTTSGTSVSIVGTVPVDVGAVGPFTSQGIGVAGLLGLAVVGFVAYAVGDRHAG
jgi:hypothetical protein